MGIIVDISFGDTATRDGTTTARQSMDNFCQAVRSNGNVSPVTFKSSGAITMFSIPNPLHPAIVHFPIVLLLIGAAVAVVSVFVSGWRLALVAAALLALGAAGALFAVKTGDSAQESLGKLPPAVETLADAHEKWAERTEIVGAVAAALAVVAAVLGTVPAWRRREKPASGNDSIHS